jgi:hypothetical protein
MLLLGRGTPINKTAMHYPFKCGILAEIYSRRKKKLPADCIKYQVLAPLFLGAQTPLIPVPVAATQPPNLFLLADHIDLPENRGCSLWMYSPTVTALRGCVSLRELRMAGHFFSHHETAAKRHRRNRIRNCPQMRMEQQIEVRQRRWQILVLIQTHLARRIMSGKTTFSFSKNLAATLPIRFPMVFRPFYAAAGEPGLCVN